MRSQPAGPLASPLASPLMYCGRLTSKEAQPAAKWPTVATEPK